MTEPQQLQTTEVIYGEVAYLLNGDQSAIAWYQNIDRGEKDNVPTLNTEHYTVYKNNSYTNILLGDVN